MLILALSTKVPKKLASVQNNVLQRSSFYTEFVKYLTQSWLLLKSREIFKFKLQIKCSLDNDYIYAHSFFYAMRPRNILNILIYLNVSKIIEVSIATF